MKNNHLIYVVSFFSGFLSLAQEIIWMRLISFAGMTVPQTFSYTLALFSYNIDLSEYSSGVYFIKCELNNGQIVVKKVIKK